MRRTRLSKYGEPQLDTRTFLQRNGAKQMDVRYFYLTNTIVPLPAA